MSRRLNVMLLILLGAGVLIFHFASKEFPSRSDVRGDIQRQEKMQAWTGKVPPDFELKLLDGSTFRLADAIGKKVILINFFATWCEPCREEMPELKRFAAEHKDPRILLLFIDANEEERKVKPFASSQLPGFSVGIDADGSLLKAYGVNAFPTTLLIDPGGWVFQYHVGALANAEVVFGPLVGMGLQALQRGKGVTRENYLARLELDQNHKSASAGLAGPALAFAQRMRCPACGKPLVKCRDMTGTKIKNRLRSMNLEKMSDEAILKALFLEEARP
jgi:thiol-disulfide isomerase/thioredoxin